MELEFCEPHDQALRRAITSQGLSEIGWQTEPERKHAITEQMAGHKSKRNFNPFVHAQLTIFMAAEEELGASAKGCPVCLLPGGGTIIEDVATQITEFIKALPDE